MTQIFICDGSSVSSSIELDTLFRMWLSVKEEQADVSVVVRTGTSRVKLDLKYIDADRTFGADGEQLYLPYGRDDSLPPVPCSAPPPPSVA